MIADKCATGSLPKRPPKVDDDTIAEIVRLDVRQVPQAQIARQTGVNRRTVGRVLERMRATLSVSADLSDERARALAVYQEVQRAAWDAVDVASALGRSPAVLLQTVVQSQQRIDTLLGLTPAGPDDPAVQMAQLKSVVVSVIQAEAPHLVPVIAQRLVERAQEQ